MNFDASSNDPTIYSSGNVGIMVADSSGFEVGKSYGLDLKEIVEG